MSTYRESVYKIHGADGYGLHETRGEDYHYFLGTVRTPLGYVAVYSEEKHTSLSIIHDGFEVSRVFNKGFSRRGLVTLARRFIEEMQ